MTADIRRLIAAEPFVPFTVHTVAGAQFHVPTVNHIAVPPAGSPIFVFGDDESYEILSPLLIHIRGAEAGSSKE